MGSGVISTVGAGVGVRRGPSVSEAVALGSAEVGAAVARVGGVGEAAPTGPGTARMLATTQAVNRPPATARMSTMAAAMIQPSAPLEDPRRRCGAPDATGATGSSGGPPPTVWY